MPGFLMDATAVVLCAHGGHASPLMLNQRVLINGHATVLLPATYSITGCPFHISIIPSPCITAQWLKGSMRIRSNGHPLLLSNSNAVCIPNGTGLIITSTQTRVAGI